MTTPPPPLPPPPAGARPTGARRPFVPRRLGVGYVLTLVVSSLAGILVVLAVVGGSVMTAGSAVPSVLALLLAVLPVPVLVGGVLAVDRLEPEPLSDLLLAFVWGAGGAVLLAGIANGVGASAIADATTDPASVDRLTATFVAPLTEEVLKGALLAGYLRFRRHQLDSLTDGLMYAAMVALGFAMTENATYYLDAAIEGGGALAALFVLRGLLTPLAHPLFTAMTGIGVAVVALRPARTWAPWVGLVGAMLLHGLWNGLASMASIAGLALAYVVLFMVLVAVVVVLVHDRRVLVGQLRTYLAPYVGGGVITPTELEELATGAGRRRVRAALGARAGRNGRTAARRFQRAATDLALLHRRVAAGNVPVEAAEAERRHLLAELQTARSALG